MSNCHVKELEHVYSSLFQDALYTFPTLGDEFERDLARLRRTVSDRGIHFYMVDLPQLGKHFDRCLSNGQYVPSCLPCSGRVGGKEDVVIPKFLRGLYLLVFDSSGCLKEDYSVEAILFLRQFFYAAKKATVACSPEKVAKEIRDFFEADSLLPEPEGFWDDETANFATVDAHYQGYARSEYYSSKLRAVSAPDLQCALSKLLATLDGVSSAVCSALGDYSPDDWNFRHGPGAISECVGPTNKYRWRNWSDRLENVFPVADYGFHNLAAWADRCSQEDEIGSIEPASRLVAVPKTYSKPRLIAAEPSEHQWCQQNIWHYFCDRTARSWLGEFVRFRDQTLNQNLCVEASVTNKLATVDLSAASDSVTCHAVGQMFRHNVPLLLALQATRTRYVTQEVTRKAPSLVALRKFSTMGNACTFPVESLLFLSICISSVLVSRGLLATRRNIASLIGEVAVFGDDIIIPNDSRELLFEGLKLLDFKVNVDKSFWTGRFRESCGVDSFDGHNVTPVYWKSPNTGKPEAVASTIEVCNNFYKKFMLNTSNYLASTLRKAMPIVYADSGVAGLRTRILSEVRSFKTRWNDRLQRYESLVPMLQARTRKTQPGDDTMLLQYFTEKPEPFTKWTSGVAQVPKLRMKYGWVSSDDLVAQPG